LPNVLGSQSDNGGNSRGDAGEDHRQFGGEGPDLNSDPLGSDRGVALWLFGCSAVVFGMVVLGGLTRLTKSGLSMVEWRPASFLPPLNEAEWAKEFDKYKQFPEYKRSAGGAGYKSRVRAVSAHMLT